MKRDLEQQARMLKDSNPLEAVKIYHEIWKDYNDEFNGWDALFTIQTLRKIECSNTDIDWAFELGEKFPEEKVTNVLGWLVFDKLVKHTNKQELISNEAKILKMAQIVPQKNLREDESYPCPVTISLFKLAKNYSKSFNKNKVEQILELINPDFLSLKEGTNNEDSEDSYSSDFEKFISLNTKLLLKLEKFNECINWCEIGLNKIESFHGNNDTWLKMRIALSEDKLGNHEKGEDLLQEILKSKAGSDKWFLYRDISEIYFEQKEYNKAWKLAVEATYYGNEPHFLIGLFLLQAKILFKLNRVNDGKLLAELIAAIITENKWGEKREYIRLFDFYKINIQEVDSVANLFSKAQTFWNNERYGNIPISNGRIILVHKNGKMGRIKDELGIVIDFHKKDLKKKLRSVENLKGSQVKFYCIKSVSGVLRAESIEVISVDNVINKLDSIGKQFKGQVKNITDFGVFIKIEGMSDGLLHKKNFKDLNFKDFKVGMFINVKIINVTDKGISLEVV
ncbi:S1 RNA-binding domain-containing protein [Flavobacterium sp. GCM10027622]|uniref:S1 RNA-binding domain-containing protein n=1 Tax=unclassified Flavobacterium TaxID=196869 RepID=UPI0036165E66